MMKSAEKKATLIDLSVNSACYAQQQKTPRDKGGRGAFVRRGTEEYGRVRKSTENKTTAFKGEVALLTPPPKAVRGG